MLVLGGGGASTSRGALVAQYTFNDQNPITVADSAGTAQNGTVNGGAAYVAVGAPGTNYAMDFDGVDDYVNFGAPAEFTAVTDLSIEVFFTPHVNNAAEKMLFGQDYTTTGVSYYQNGRIYSYAGGGARNLPAEVSENVAYHAVFTWDYDAGTNQGTHRMYLDGVEVSGSPAVWTNQITFAGVDWVAGRDDTTSGDARYDGLIDEIRYYDHALSASEVSASFAAGPTLVPEPASIGMIAAGLLLASRRRRRRA
jgi:hypothetical protein